MTDERDFEIKLGAAIKVFASGADRPFDSMTLARRILDSPRRGPFGRIWPAAVVGESLRPRLSSPVLVAASVVVLLLVGFALYSNQRGTIVGPPAPSPTPAGSDLPAASPNRSPSVASNLSMQCRALPAGAYRGVVGTTIAVTVTLPSGWHGVAWEDEVHVGIGNCIIGGDSVWLNVSLVSDVPSNACHWRETAVAVDSPDAVTAALVAQEGHETIAPIDFTLGGYPATRFEFSVPQDQTGREECDEGGGRIQLWQVPGAPVDRGQSISPGESATVYIVDVGGTALAVAAIREQTSPSGDVAELDAIVASLRIDPPTPGASPSPGPTTGSLPVELTAVIARHVAALNSHDTEAFIDTFADVGAFNPRGTFKAQSIFANRLSMNLALIELFMEMSEAWRFQAEVVSCEQLSQSEHDRLHGPNDGNDSSGQCTVKSRWSALSLEIGESWRYVFDGTSIMSWSQSVRDAALVDRTLPLGIDGLLKWEAWLESTDPVASARLLNPRRYLVSTVSCGIPPEPPCEWTSEGIDVQRIVDGTRTERDFVVAGQKFSPSGLIPYDPAHAAEIEASINQFLAERARSQ